MRIPRPRFTVRRLMVAVAIVGVVMGATTALNRRSARFWGLRYRHALAATKSEERRPGYCMPFSTPRSEYHDAMRDKYHQAAIRPWLPVAPDPPEPE